MNPFEQQLTFSMIVFFSFMGFLVGVPFVLSIARLLGVYTVVNEREFQVFTLFGKVEKIIDQPGLYFLWPELKWKAPLINWMGRVYFVDGRLDQQYSRSLAVNSEEGAPMGIGVWFEFEIKDAVAHLFANDDPRGSLAANVSNSTVRSLSNMPLGKMLADRHVMSKTVREEVSPDSIIWGYKTGSVYIRKVHFRDTEMIHQIESKVVNRLRQVTSAIKQDGANQVNIITSSAEKEAAVEFARAAAVRPKIVGQALREISQDPEIAESLFDILETQRIIESKAEINLIPKGQSWALGLLSPSK